jgi:hypothetical protein
MRLPKSRQPPFWPPTTAHYASSARSVTTPNTRSTWLAGYARSRIATRWTRTGHCVSRSCLRGRAGIGRTVCTSTLTPSSFQVSISASLFGGSWRILFLEVYRGTQPSFLCLSPLLIFFTSTTRPLALLPPPPPPRADKKSAGPSSACACDIFLVCRRPDSTPAQQRLLAV